MVNQKSQQKLSLPNFNLVKAALHSATCRPDFWWQLGKKSARHKKSVALRQSFYVRPIFSEPPASRTVQTVLNRGRA